MVDRLGLLDQANMIAVTIAECEDPTTWPCWISYILEAMEDKADKEKYADFLRRLRFAITTRLDAGEW